MDCILQLLVALTKLNCLLLEVIPVIQDLSTNFKAHYFTIDGSRNNVGSTVGKLVESGCLLVKELLKSDGFW